MGCRYAKLNREFGRVSRISVPEDCAYITDDAEDNDTETITDGESNDVDDNENGAEGSSELTEADSDENSGNSDCFHLLNLSLFLYTFL